MPAYFFTLFSAPLPRRCHSERFTFTLHAEHARYAAAAMKRCCERHGAILPCRAAIASAGAFAALRAAADAPFSPQRFRFSLITRRLMRRCHRALFTPAMQPPLRDAFDFSLCARCRQPAAAISFRRRFSPAPAQRAIELSSISRDFISAHVTPPAQRAARPSRCCRTFYVD